MSNTRKQAAEKLVGSLLGKRIEIEDIFQEVPVPRQSYHSSDGKDHTIVLCVRFEETEMKYKGLRGERYGSIYFDNLWISDTDLKTAKVPAELWKFLEQERNGGKVVFLTGMEFNEKQAERNLPDRGNWPWVHGRDIKVVFALDPDLISTNRKGFSTQDCSENGQTYRPIGNNMVVLPLSINR